MPSLFLIIAHHHEARPFIDALRLKKEMKSHSFEVFRSQTVKLIISGIGKVRSGMAVAHLCGIYPPDASDVIANVGLCAGHSDIQIGSVIRANYVQDAGTSKGFAPDILYHEKCIEGRVVTVDKPKLDMPDPETFYDMEASGFMEGAYRYFSPERSFILKTVSDHGNFFKISKEYVEKCIYPAILPTLRLASKILEPENFDECFISLIQGWSTEVQNNIGELKASAVRNGINTASIFSEASLELGEPHNWPQVSIELMVSKLKN